MDRREAILAIVPGITTLALAGCSLFSNPSAQAQFDKLVAAAVAVDQGIQAVLPQLQTLPQFSPALVAKVSYWANAVTHDLQTLQKAVDLNSGKVPAQQLVGDAEALFAILETVQGVPQPVHNALLYAQAALPTIVAILSGL